MELVTVFNEYPPFVKLPTDLMLNEGNKTF